MLVRSLSLVGLGAALSASAILAYQYAVRQSKTRRSNDMLKSNEVTPGDDDDDDLICEQLTRNHAFFGDEGLAKVRGAFIVVVGLGGVGKL
jgi:hypothetical protein